MVISRDRSSQDSSFFLSRCFFSKEMKTQCLSSLLCCVTAKEVFFSEDTISDKVIQLPINKYLALQRSCYMIHFSYAA